MEQRLLESESSWKIDKKHLFQQKNNIFLPPSKVIDTTDLAVLLQPHITGVIDTQKKYPLMRT